MNDSSRDAGSGNLVTEQVKQTAQSAVESTQQAAGQAAGQAFDQAKSRLDSQKDQGAETLSQAAQALRHAGEDLRQQNGTVAGVVDSAATQIDRAAGYLQSHSVDQLVGEAEDLARRNSTVFLGGAFVVGLLAARFLKSSPPRRQYSPNGGQHPYRSGGVSYGGQMYGGQPSGQYSYGNVQYPYEDVQGAPYVVRDYSPGLMGKAGGTGASGNGE
jgi:uncharacterized protein YukE